MTVNTRQCHSAVVMVAVVLALHASLAIAQRNVDTLVADHGEFWNDSGRAVTTGCAHSVSGAPNQQDLVPYGDPDPAQVALIPIEATGPFAIDGDEIVIPSGGQTVTLEIQISDWDPYLLRLYQLNLDMDGFFSGDAGTAIPVGSDRPFDFHEFVPCDTDEDCPLNWPVCSRFAYCFGPDFEPEAGAFMDTSRPDYVFYGLEIFPGLDYLWFRFGDVALGGNAVPYEGPPKYAATLIFDVSEVASGTFTLGFDEPASYLKDLWLQVIPVVFSPGRITIQPPTCGNGECELGEDEESCPEDCVEPPVCGNDVCEPGEDEESCPADCGEPPIDGIPTVSTWGLVILTGLLLVGGKIYFGRRRVPRYAA